MTYEASSSVKPQALAPTSISEAQIAQHRRLCRHADRQGADGSRGEGISRQGRTASRT